MKVKRIDLPGSGKFSRDCELISLTNEKGLTLTYHKDSDDTYWKLQCEIIPAYKVVGEEFSTIGYLSEIPADGSIFEVLNSPWMNELFEDEKINEKYSHYVLFFYDECVEVIAHKFYFNKIEKRK
jgi:hypothetical protein